MRPFTAADLETTLAAVRDTAGEAQHAVDTVIAAGEAALRVLPAFRTSIFIGASAPLRQANKASSNSGPELLKK